MIEKPFYTEIEVAFKSVNIKSSNIIESFSSSDEILLFKPKILQTIKFVREKKKCPDVNSIMNTLAKLELLISTRTPCIA